MPPLLSVILPTSGRPVELERTLSRLFDQTLPADEFEVLVVENGPRAGARRVTRRATRRHARHQLRYIHEPTPGLLSGRHRGAREAQGELLVFADDDIDASPEWLHAIVETFGEPAVHLVGGRNLPCYESIPPPWVEGFWYTPPYGGRACIYLSLLDLGDDSLEIDGNYVWGLNFGIRRATLFELGGFHPDSMPADRQHLQGDGETGLTLKLNQAGLRAVYQPRALVHHRVPSGRLTADYFRRRSFFQGVCDSFTALRRDPSILAERGEAPPPGAQTSELPATGEPSRWPLMRRLFRRGNERPGPAVHLAKPTFSEVETQVHAAHRFGYDFHQTAVSRSAVLLDWVLRPDYWDYSLPLVPMPGAARRLREAALGDRSTSR